MDGYGFLYNLSEYSIIDVNIDMDIYGYPIMIIHLWILNYRFGYMNI